MATTPTPLPGCSGADASESGVGPALSTNADVGSGISACVPSCPLHTPGDALGIAAVDLVEEWNEIEQLDLEIARKIRKRRLE